MSGRVLVLGDGGWGTALALAAHRAGNPVTVWSVDPDYAAEVAATRVNRKFLPGVPLPEALRWTGDAAEAVDGADLVLSVVPTQYVAGVAERFAGRLRGLPVVSASKGLELDTMRLPTEILAATLGAGVRLGALSGPSHAEELARGRVTSVVAASPDAALAEEVQRRMTSEVLRVYTNPDLRGVEIGGALKNIVAIAAGICDGLDLGDNAKAALVDRGLLEMARWGTAHGARRETFLGLSGAGDLVVTCYSRHSRNRGLGERIGRGETLDAILESTEKVAEGVWTCRAVHAAAAQEGIRMPVTAAVHAVLFDGVPPADVVRRLMERPPGAELAE